MLDLRKMNNKPQKYAKWFDHANKMLETITAVNARRHSSTMHLKSFYSVRDFMTQVEDFMEINCSNEEEKEEVPSESTVTKEFLVSNPYHGVTPSTMSL